MMRPTDPRVMLHVAMARLWPPENGNPIFGRVRLRHGNEMNQTWHGGKNGDGFSIRDWILRGSASGRGLLMPRHSLFKGGRGITVCSSPRLARSVIACRARETLPQSWDLLNPVGFYRTVSGCDGTVVRHPVSLL